MSLTVKKVLCNIEYHTSYFTCILIYYDDVMSQEDVRQLLLELGGEATVSDLSELARNVFSDRKLHTYVNGRLQSMEKKGMVEKVNEYKKKWRLTQKGKLNSITSPVDEIDVIVDENDLEQRGLSLVNLVGSLHLEQNFDLSALSTDIGKTEYHPETYPSMIYRPFEDRSISVLTPSSGRLSIVGARSKQELIDGADDFLATLSSLNIEIKVTSSDILIQNIVVNYDLGREFDLSAVAVAFGLNDVEYEPAQFSGLIYRSHVGSSTVLMFASGKVVVTGASTYSGIIQAQDELHERLEEIGVEL